MSLSHHPSEALLLDYALGSLAEGWSLAVAAHLSLCPMCRQQVAEMEALGGALMHDCPPAIAGDDLWQRVAARMDAPEGAREVAAAPPCATSILPAPLRDYTGGAADNLAWRRLGLGAEQVVLKPRQPGTSARLLRIAPGQRVPAHGHAGLEVTVVLSGAFSDETGRYGRGDFQELDGEIEHQPWVDGGEPCICLAVTDAPLRFKSLAAKLAQPLLGI